MLSQSTIAFNLMPQLGATVCKSMLGPLQIQTVTDTNVNPKQILAAVPAASVLFLLLQFTGIVGLPSSSYRKRKACFKDFLSFNYGFLDIGLMWVQSIEQKPRSI